MGDGNAWETGGGAIPRPRVRERLAAGRPGDMSEVELLALILDTGTARQDVAAVARELLARFGDLRGLSRASLPELQRQPGIGPAKASRLQASLELGRRSIARAVVPGDPIRSSQQVFDTFRPRLAHMDREHMVAVLLDTKHRVLKEVCLSVGCLDSTLVHPREVFRPAVVESAAAVILVHNHPSGDPTPSAEDRAVTRRLVANAELLGVELLDHVIVAQQGCVSLRDRGEM